MTIQEQIAIAEKRGIVAITPEKVSNALVMEIKSMFRLDKEFDDWLRGQEIKWANAKMRELVKSKRYDFNDPEQLAEAKRVCIRFARSMAERISRCSESVHSIMVWTIENNDVENLLIEINEKLNETYKSHLDLRVFDAYGSTVEDYLRAINDIEKNEGSQTVMLVKNITRANADLYNEIYCDVKTPKRLPCYIVLTSSIKLPEGEKEMWNLSMDVPHIALLTE